MTLLIILSVVIPATALILVLFIALYRHVKVLSSAVQRFRDDIEPVAERIRTAGDDARRKLDALPARLPSGRAGARLRR